MPESALSDYLRPDWSDACINVRTEEAYETAHEAVSYTHLEHDLTVYLVLYDRDSLAVSRKLFASVEEYIDDHYVAQNDESYGYGRRRRESVERRQWWLEEALSLIHI